MWRLMQEMLRGVMDDGSAGSVDNIRIGLYVDRKWIPYPYMIWNKDFDWDSIVLFE